MAPKLRRDAAPLLDELGASIDHVKAFARGGAQETSNFAAVCAHCNTRKSARRTEDYLAEATPWQVKGKHGEPFLWDGLSALFLTLARDQREALSPNEQRWVAAIEQQLASRRPDRRLDAAKHRQVNDGR